MPARLPLALLAFGAIAAALWWRYTSGETSAPAPTAKPMTPLAGEVAGPPAEPTTRPNVIIVSIDTVRADHLGAYGYERATSPFLDSLARRGVVFERAFANASWTLPSHMSLLTGTYPRTHGVEQSDRTLGPAIPTLAQQLQGAGYATQAFVSWVFLKASYGFDRGFDRYIELLPPGQAKSTAHETALPANVVTDRVICVLSRRCPRLDVRQV